MRILGIDPGYERIGIAILDKIEGKESLVYSTCFKTDSALEFEERLVLIALEIDRVITEYEPTVLAIERLFFDRNTTTALKVSEAKGVITQEAKQAGLRVYEYTPLQIKVAATGYGKASKEDVRKMVPLLLKGVDVSKKIDDEVDAIAIALTGSASIRY